MNILSIFLITSFFIVIFAIILNLFSHNKFCDKNINERSKQKSNRSCKTY